MRWSLGKSERLVFAALLCLGLGGCGTIYFPWEKGRAPTTLPVAAKEVGKETNATAPKANDVLKTETSEKTVKPKAKQTASKPVEPEVELPREAAPSRHPNDLVGRDESAVSSMIGAPATTRNDGSAMIWSYRAPGCALDVFFFLDVQSNTRRVLSYDLKADAPDAEAADRCYAQFRGV